MASNVLGGELISCSLNPVTGFFRNGLCDTCSDDRGMHTVCAIMTDEFLEFSANVIIWDIDKKELDKASKEINNDKLSFHVVDVSRVANISHHFHTLENFGIDVWRRPVTWTHKPLRPKVRRI